MIRDPLPDPDEMFFWSLQERGFFAEPEETDLPCFFDVKDRPIIEICNDPILQVRAS